MERKVYKGNFIFTKTKDSFTCLEAFYLVTENGKVKGLFPKLPSQYEGYMIEEYKNGFIIPGFTDLHLHAPQYENIGLGMDKELLPWLDTYTFPEEAKFADCVYAEGVYTQFVRELWKMGTTSAVIFGTIHKEATLVLFELMKKTGLRAYVGKVNMDRNASPELTESTAESLRETEDFLRSCLSRGIVKPIITPRFVPSCSEELMEGLGRLAEDYQVPVQSHLSENKKEIEWVLKLHPFEKTYGGVYRRYGLLGTTPTVMAHCVHSNEEEIELLKEHGVFIAHCPTSNSNVASGTAPVKKFLSRGLRAGLGSDISGGHTLWMPDIIVHAMQVSKIYAATYGENPMQESINLSEAFYMATKGGGEFFGKVGSFEEGFEFDALVIDDTSLTGERTRLSLKERLEKFLYKGDYRCIVKRIVGGKEVN